MGRRKSTNSVEISRTEHGQFRFIVAVRGADGKRTRSYFIGKREAEQFAARKQQELETAATVLELTEGERQSVFLARSQGVDLLRAVQAQVAAMEAEASKDNTTVEECVAAWLEELEKVRRSGRYLGELRQFFGRLMPKWGELPVRAVTADMVAAEVHGSGARGKEVSDSTKAGYRRLLHGFFSYAVGRRLRPDNPAKEVRQLRALTWADEDVRILTTEQARALIAAAAEHEPDLLPAVAIGLYAGLRSAELMRLSWRDVQLQRGLIVVSAKKAKTSSRRMVTVEPCLAALLEGRELGGEESVWPLNGPRMWDRVIKAAGWRGHLHWPPKVVEGAPLWPPNAMRHSFVSYHVAAFGDPARTAMEAGHSVEVLHRHYRQLVSQAEGEEYWTAGTLEQR